MEEREVTSISQADLLIKKMAGGGDDREDFEDYDKLEANDIIDELVAHRNDNQASNDAY